QPRRAQTTGFGGGIRYFFNTIIVNIGRTELDREVQRLPEAADADRHAITLLIPIQGVVPVFASDLGSANGYEDVTLLQSATFGGRIRVQWSKSKRLAILAGDDDACRVGLACRGPGQAPPAARQSRVVRWT